MAYKNIIYNKEKGIARITVNRPEVRNALDGPTRAELRAVVREIDQDEDVKVAIITGAGDKAFISGADISAVSKMTPTEMEDFASTLGTQLYLEIENLRVPIIAMINGFCLGGGCELAMACDIRIASEKAKFGQPEVNLGIMPGGGGTQRLPRLIGWGRAKELVYTGRTIDAVEAERLGLVNRVVPADKLEETVMGLAQDIASKSTLIMRLIKKTMNNGMYTDLRSALNYEKSNLALCFSSEDSKEGTAAFLEKRKPMFKGK